jgi:hypothetical protein
MNESIFLAGFFPFIGGSKISCLLCKFTDQGAISNGALQFNKGTGTNGALLWKPLPHDKCWCPYALKGCHEPWHPTTTTGHQG